LSTVDGTLAEKSAVLAAAPALSFDAAEGFYGDGEAVRRRAKEVIADVPCPPDRNSAAALSWGDHEQMTSLVESDIQLMVQLNAMSDWLHYTVETAASGQLIPDIQDVLAHLPQWPAVRQLPWSDGLAAAIWRAAPETSARYARC
jgi:hypothetical protein